MKEIKQVELSIARTHSNKESDYIELVIEDAEGYNIINVKFSIETYGNLLTGRTVKGEAKINKR